ncbi:hypothetical protein TARUN_6938 [Trichoderma arundinaceum]|uniref:BZIP domain-containing protein n=1 Tax=Trichoderma arundinaceum TaxID=490622 RepID=A0A395NHA1_TRIAR|nr:hypothetical protein TARUN_6938 [Trichoderma arundinaceum]
MDESNPPKAKPRCRTYDSIERRRLQNRRAQHNYRLREAAKARQDKRIIKGAPIQHAKTFLLQLVHKPRSKPQLQVAAPRLSCGAHFASAQHLVLSADHQFLTLVHNNIIRGLIANASLLNYPWSTICQDDSLSGYCTPAPNLDLSMRSSSLPSSLQPTSIQHKEMHHPWLDLVPSPRFRDNIIRRLAAPSQGWDFETELCEDLTGAGKLQLSCSRPGFMLWGENSWDTRNWEVTEEFARKWPDIIDGCSDLIASTNNWRKKRGESRLCVSPSIANSSIDLLIPSY